MPRALRAVSTAEICGSLSAAHTPRVLQLQNSSSCSRMAPAGLGAPGPDLRDLGTRRGRSCAWEGNCSALGRRACRVLPPSPGARVHAHGPPRPGPPRPGPPGWRPHPRPDLRASPGSGPHPSPTPRVWPRPLPRYVPRPPSPGAAPPPASRLPVPLGAAPHHSAPRRPPGARLAPTPPRSTQWSPPRSTGSECAPPHPSAPPPAPPRVIPAPGRPLRPRFSGGARC